MTTAPTSRPQFAMIPYTVLNAGLSGKTLAVYAQLVKYAGSDDACFPSRATIAKSIGLKKAANIDSAIAELVTAGFITVRPVWKNKDGVCSHDHDDEFNNQTSSLYVLTDLE